MAEKQEINELAELMSQLPPETQSTILHAIRLAVLIEAAGENTQKAG